MTQNIQVEVLLVVVSPGLQSTEDLHFLLEEVDGRVCVPSLLLRENLTGHGTAAELLYHLTWHSTGAYHGWLRLKPAVPRDEAQRTRDGIRVLGLPYVCMISKTIESITIRRGRWYSLPELIARNAAGEIYQDHFEIVMDACNTL